MRERDKTLTTDQKALAINLDKYKFGTIVEIGAGQEVARHFFHVGAAAGTIAKTMSAYDMAISDDIYGQVDRYVSRLGNIATMKPEVLDRFDADRWADAYADMLGIDPELIVPGEKAALIRQQRVEAQQAQQQMAMMAQGAEMMGKMPMC